MLTSVSRRSPFSMLACRAQYASDARRVGITGTLYEKATMMEPAETELIVTIELVKVLVARRLLRTLAMARENTFLSKFATVMLVIGGVMIDKVAPNVRKPDVVAVLGPCVVIAVVTDDDDDEVPEVVVVGE